MPDLCMHAGCVTTLSNLVLRVSTLAHASRGPSTTPGLPSPARFLSLAPSFTVDQGGQLVLENVTVVSSELHALYSGVCGAWSFSASAQLSAAGVLTLAGEHATATGLLLRNVTILPRERTVVRSAGSSPSSVGAAATQATAATAAPSMDAQAAGTGRPIAASSAAGDTATRTLVLPCTATPVSDAASLNVLLAGVAAHQPLYVSLAGNITIDASAWQLVRLVRDARFCLLGDPKRATLLDFGGATMGGVLGSTEVYTAGVVRFHDLLLVNMVAWDVPTSALSALASLVPPILIRRAGSKVLGAPFEQQVVLARCTLFVSDAEARWMRSALPPMTTYVQTNETGFDSVYSWTASDMNQFFRPVNVSVSAPQVRVPLVWCARLGRAEPKSETGGPFPASEKGL